MLNEDSRLRGAVPRIEVRRAAGAVFSRMRGALFASASSIENCSDLFAHAPGFGAGFAASARLRLRTHARRLPLH